MTLPLGTFITPVGHYGVATIASRGARLASLFGVAAFLSAEEYGRFAFVVLVANYLIHLNLGAGSALPVLLPSATSAERDDYLWSGLIFTLGASAAALVAAVAFSAEAMIAAALGVSQLLYTFANMVGRAAERLESVALQRYAQALILLGSVPLAAYLSYRLWVVTFVALNLLLAIGSLFSVRHLTSLRRRRFRFDAILRLWSVGIPAMIVGALYQLLTSVDRVFLESTGDTTTFARYSIAAIGLQVVATLSQPLSEIYVVRMAKSDSDLGALFHAFRRKAVALSLAAGTVIIAFLPMLAEVMNDAYADIRGLVSLAVLAGIGANIVVLYGSVFLARGRRWSYVAIMATVALLLIATLWITGLYRKDVNVLQSVSAAALMLTSLCLAAATRRWHRV